MSISPLVEIQHEMARAVGAAADTWRAEPNDGARTLGAEELIGAAWQLREGLRRIWEGVLDRARADQLREFEEAGQMLRGLAESTLDVMTRVIDLARETAVGNGPELRHLSELEAESAKVKTWLEGELHTWPWVETPMRPFDPEQIAQARASYARGEWEY